MSITTRRRASLAQIRRMTHDERVELFWEILDRVTFIRNLPLAGRIRHLGELKPLTLTFNRLLKMTNAASENYCTNTTAGEH